jgi:hypothetical protein
MNETATPWWNIESNPPRHLRPGQNDGTPEFGVLGANTLSLFQTFWYTNGALIQDRTIALGYSALPREADGISFSTLWRQIEGETRELADALLEPSTTLNPVLLSVLRWWVLHGTLLLHKELVDFPAKTLVEDAAALGIDTTKEPWRDPNFGAALRKTPTHTAPTHAAPTAARWSWSDVEFVFDGWKSAAIFHKGIDLGRRVSQKSLGISNSAWLLLVALAGGGLERPKKRTDNTYQTILIKELAKVVPEAEGKALENLDCMFRASNEELNNLKLQQKYDRNKITPHQFDKAANKLRVQCDQKREADKRRSPLFSLAKD